MKRIKVGFVLLSNSRNPIPSTRIAVLNTFSFLRASHFDPHIVYEPEQGNATPDLTGLGARVIGEGFDIVVFQKVYGPSVEQLVRELRTAGIRTVFCVCDVIDSAMAAATDATVVVTDFLKSLYPPSLQHKIRVVHDGIERPDVHKADWRGSPGKRVRAVLVTSAHLDKLPQIGTPPSWLDVTIVGRYLPEEQRLQRLRQARWVFTHQQGVGQSLAYLRFLMNSRIHCAAWDPQRVYQQMQQADIGIIPVEDDAAMDTPGQVPSWKVKSENRLSMKMCIGLPVIATPIPSYEPLVQHGSNGYLARTPAQWLEYLGALRDPALREQIGKAARASVLERYSMAEQSRLLMAVFDDLMLAPAAAG